MGEVLHVFEFAWWNFLYEIVVLEYFCVVIKHILIIVKVVSSGNVEETEVLGDNQWPSASELTNFQGSASAGF